MTRLEEASHDVAKYISTLSEYGMTKSEYGMTKVMCAISYPGKCLFCKWAENEEKCLKSRCEDGIKAYLEADE